MRLKINENITLRFSRIKAKRGFAVYSRKSNCKYGTLIQEVSSVDEHSHPDFQHEATMAIARAAMKKYRKVGIELAK